MHTPTLLRLSLFCEFTATLAGQQWVDRTLRPTLQVQWHGDGVRNEAVVVGPGRSIRSWRGDGWLHVGTIPQGLNALPAFVSDPGTGLVLAAVLDNQLTSRTALIDPDDWSVQTLLPGIEAFRLLVDPGTGQVMALVQSTPQSTQDYLWNGTGWTALAPNLRPAALQIVVADPARARLVGVVASGPTMQVHEWNGQAWTQVPSPLAPPARTAPALLYDPLAGHVLMFGGDANGVPRNDTWSWNGSTWTNLAPATTPAAGGIVTLTYDRSRAMPVLFASGGTQDHEWTGTDWRVIRACPRPSSYYQVASGPGSIVHYASDVVHTWNGLAWQATAAPGPTDRASQFASLPSGDFVLFGGSRVQLLPFGFVTLGDTWSWNGANWTQHAPSQSPSVRRGHALVTSLGWGGAILHGGESATGTPLVDTWLWNGTTWSDVTPFVGTTGGGRAVGASGPIGTDPYVLVGNQVLQLTTAWNLRSGNLPQLNERHVSVTPQGNALLTGVDPTGLRTFELVAGVWLPRGAAPEYFDASVHDPVTGTLQGFARGQYFAFTQTPATTGSFGSGCGAPAPTLVATAEPLVGNLALRLAASECQTLAWFGADFASASTPVGGGCTSYLTSAITLGFTTPNAAGVASLGLPLPPITALRGFDVFAQAVTLQNGGPLGGFAASAGLRLSLGD